jgi:hypothetical protein
MFPVKCTQCDKIVARKDMPFHLRDAHSPRRLNITPVEPAQQPQPIAESWERFRANQATPPPDVQEDRNSFRLEIQNIVREFNVLSSQACQECSDNVEDMPVLGVSPSALYWSVDVMIRVRLCMRIPSRTLNSVLQIMEGRG